MKQRVGHLEQVIKTKKIWLVIGAVVLLVAGGIFAYGPARQWVANRLSSPSSEQPNPVTPTPTKQIDEAQELIRNGNTDGAMRLYDGLIKDTKDNEAKQRMLVTQAGLALDAQQYDRAIEAGKQALAIKKTVVVLGTLALAYEQKGDKALAVDYYTQAVKQMEAEASPEMGPVGAAYPAYQRKINELQAQ